MAFCSDISANVNNYIQSRDLCIFDIVFNNKAWTYVNDALNHQSIIDYSLCYNVTKLISFEEIDPPVNLSDHLPLLTICSCNLNSTVDDNTDHNADSIKAAPAVVQLRWDHADLSQYYTETGSLLQSLLLSLNDAEDNLSCSPDGAPVYVEQIYDKFVHILRNSADSFIPKHKANFLQILVGPVIK